MSRNPYREREYAVEVEIISEQPAAGAPEQLKETVPAFHVEQ